VRHALTALLAMAEEKLRAARLLLEGEAWGDASSRAYYAAFHAVSAVLLSRDESYSHHAQVLGAFNRGFVHTGLFPKEFTVLLTRLFENRQNGDYAVCATVQYAHALIALTVTAIISFWQRVSSPRPCVLTISGI
jgi:uncharacterized protein (UPF0332 family)